MSRPPTEKQDSASQRLFLFLLLSVSIFVLTNSFFAPPLVKDEQAVADKDEQAADGDLDAGNLTAADPTGVKSDGTDASPNDGADSTADQPEEPEAEPRQLSLGSVDAESGEKLHVMFDNAGATVTRVELASPRYRDLHDRSGYLGHLNPVAPSQGDGAEITVVGQGTPAQSAGLAVGDVITAAEVLDEKSQAKEIVTPGDWRRWLITTEPKQEVKLTYERDGQSDTTQLTMRRRPLEVIRPESENLALHSKQQPDGFQESPSFGLRVASLNGNRNSDEVKRLNQELSTGNWDVESSDAQQVTFRKRFNGLGLEFIKRYTLATAGGDDADQATNAAEDKSTYHFDLEVEIQNLKQEPQKVAYVLDGPSGLPMEGWWFANKIGRGWSGFGLRDVIARYQGSKTIQHSCKSIAAGDVEPMGQGTPLAYIGVDSLYFTAAVLPKKERLSDVWFDDAELDLATKELESKGTLPTYNNPTFKLTHTEVELAANGSNGSKLSDAFTIYTGPKKPELLAQYAASGDKNYRLHDFLYYGWFGPVAQLMLIILHGFYAIVGNYGVSIILLTVLVRSAMFPLSRKQAMNMAKMQELKPEMDRIASKYKEDMEKRTKAQQDLFRKHNYNPMGGCMMMFVQLPIFIGLYRALAVDVELRQASFFSESIRFCSNLAAPDMFFDWSAYMPLWVNNGQGFLGLGPFLNLLPIFTIVLFLLQQKMFMPEATSEQAILQQKMMKYMMIFFGLMFFKVPSGLCLYFIASSVWAITERKLLPKPNVPVSTAPATNPEPRKIASSKTPNKKKKSGKKRK